MHPLREGVLMAYGFEVGRHYNRVADVHAHFGGNRRAGIITTRVSGGSTGPIFIISGEGGTPYGYADRWREDGVFEYYGQGEYGDMKMARGNLAIANHCKDGRSLLLFEKQKDGNLLFRGEMVLDHHYTRAAPDRGGNLRQAIVFDLRQLAAIVEKDVDAPAFATDLSQLRELAFSAAAPSTAVGVAKRNVYQRSADVKAYVLARANGVCHGCGEPAPFQRKDGSPYLEPHHIRRASDGGPDDPRFVIALCPNCHRRVHAGADGPAFNDALLKLMAQIEPKVWV